MGSPSIPKPPAPPPPPPTPIDPSVLEARRRARGRGRRGRLSTILTGPQGLQNRGSISQATLLGGVGTTSAGAF